MDTCMTIQLESSSFYINTILNSFSSFIKMIFVRRRATNSPVNLWPFDKFQCIHNLPYWMRFHYFQALMVESISIYGEWSGRIGYSVAWLHSQSAPVFRHLTMAHHTMSLALHLAIYSLRLNCYLRDEYRMNWIACRYWEMACLFQCDLPQSGELLTLVWSKN